MFREIVDIYSSPDVIRLDFYLTRGVLQQIGTVQFERLLMKPNNHCRKSIGPDGQFIGLCKQIAPTQINFVFQLQDYRLLRNGESNFAVVDDDCFHPAALPRWQRDNSISRSNRTAGHTSGKTTKTCIRPNHALDGKSKFAESLCWPELYGFKVFHERRARVPRHACATLDDVVALKRTYRNRLHRESAQRARQVSKILLQP